MYIIVTIFLTSLVGLCGMILCRGWEIKKGKMSPATEGVILFSKQEIQQLSEICYSCIPKEYARRLMNTAVHHGKGFSQKAMMSLGNSSASKRVHAFIDSIRGKYIIREDSKKPSSAFIQDILAHKEQFRNNNEEL